MLLKLTTTGRQNGYSLIELSIVLIVIGLLISMGVKLLGPSIERAAETSSKAILSGNVDTVVGYGVANQTLPRFDRSDNTADADDFRNVLANPLDDFGSNFGYLFDPRFITNGALYSIANGAPPATFAGGSNSNNALCNRFSETLIQLRSCSDAACAAVTRTVSDVAFVLWSVGSNGASQIQVGNADGTSGGLIDITAAGFDPSITQVISIFDGNVAINGQPFDDLVEWVTLAELRATAGCAAQSLSVMTGNLPDATSGAAYGTSLFADGGIPFAAGGNYKWCVETVTGLPTPIGFQYDGGVAPAANCSMSEDDAQWVQSDLLDIDVSALAVPGNYGFRVFVRDDSDSRVVGVNNDNIVSKTMALTIN